MGRGRITRGQGDGERDNSNNARFSAALADPLASLGEYQDTAREIVIGLRENGVRLSSVGVLTVAFAVEVTFRERPNVGVRGQQLSGDQLRDIVPTVVRLTLDEPHIQVNIRREQIVPAPTLLYALGQATNQAISFLADGFKGPF